MMGYIDSFENWYTEQEKHNEEMLTWFRKAEELNSI